jgi:hypothetical protein
MAVGLLKEEAATASVNPVGSAAIIRRPSSGSTASGTQRRIGELLTDRHLGVLRLHRSERVLRFIPDS